jgi:hypothetical protein
MMEIGAHTYRPEASMAHHRAVAVALLCLLAAGCRSSGESDTEPTPVRGPATVEVDNRGFLDMTVYVLEGAQRQRLGIAPGHARTRLTIPDRMVRGGSASLRFLCDPIGGRGTPVSEEIVVEPGDVVELIIPSS